MTGEKRRGVGRWTLAGTNVTCESCGATFCPQSAQDNAPDWEKLRSLNDMFVLCRNCDLMLELVPWGGAPKPEIHGEEVHLSNVILPPLDGTEPFVVGYTKTTFSDPLVAQTNEGLLANVAKMPAKKEPFQIVDEAHNFGSCTSPDEKARQAAKRGLDALKYTSETGNTFYDCHNSKGESVFDHAKGEYVPAPEVDEKPHRTVEGITLHRGAILFDLGSAIRALSAILRGTKNELKRLVLGRVIEELKEMSETIEIAERIG